MTLKTNILSFIFITLLGLNLSKALFADSSTNLQEQTKNLVEQELWRHFGIAPPNYPKYLGANPQNSELIKKRVETNKKLNFLFRQRSQGLELAQVIASWYQLLFREKFEQDIRSEEQIKSAYNKQFNIISKRLHLDELELFYELLKLDIEIIKETIANTAKKIIRKRLNEKRVLSSHAPINVILNGDSKNLKLVPHIMKRRMIVNQTKIVHSSFVAAINDVFKTDYVALKGSWRYYEFQGKKIKVLYVKDSNADGGGK